MPHKFFRFPSRDHVKQHPTTPQPTTAPPPPLPPKADAPKVSQPVPLAEFARARRETSPPIPIPQVRLGPPRASAARLPHRASASDSFAQGTAWRAPGSPEVPAPANIRKTAYATGASTPLEGPPGGRPLRRSRGHQPIAQERERRSQAEALLQERTDLKKQIDEETVRLSQIKQQQEALRREREQVSNARRATEERNRAKTASENLYGRSQSTPMLNESSPYSRGRSTAQSQESFRSTSSHEPDFRRVWSRTPSVSSNDRSPPPGRPHWQKLEQARREKEREYAMQKLLETRAQEKKAFEDAWSVYESRWMLLAFATRAIVQSQTTEAHQQAQGHLTLSFQDIPWPMVHPPRASHDITAVGIRRFFASEQPSGDKTHRDCIKEALLRWHPDRFGSRVLDHVREAHREEVRRSVDIVASCLNDLLSRA